MHLRINTFYLTFVRIRLVHPKASACPATVTVSQRCSIQLHRSCCTHSASAYTVSYSMAGLLCTTSFQVRQQRLIVRHPIATY